MSGGVDCVRRTDEHEVVWRTALGGGGLDDLARLIVVEHRRHQRDRGRARLDAESHGREDLIDAI